MQNKVISYFRDYANGTALDAPMTYSCVTPPASPRGKRAHEPTHLSPGIGYSTSADCGSPPREASIQPFCPPAPKRHNHEQTDTQVASQIRNFSQFIWENELIDLELITTPRYHAINPNGGQYHDVYKGITSRGQTLIVKVLQSRHAHSTAKYQTDMFQTGCDIQLFLEQNKIPVIPMICSAKTIIQNRVWVLPFCETWTPTPQERQSVGLEFFKRLFEAWRNTYQIVLPDLKPDNVMMYQGTPVIMDFFEEAPTPDAIGAELANRLQMWDFTKEQSESLKTQLLDVARHILMMSPADPAAQNIIAAFFTYPPA